MFFRRTCIVCDLFISHRSIMKDKFPITTPSTIEDEYSWFFERHERLRNCRIVSSYVLKRQNSTFEYIMSVIVVEIFHG